LAVLRGCGASLSPQISFPDPRRPPACSTRSSIPSSDSESGWPYRPEYPSENIYGFFGTNYIFEGEPDSLLDQLIARFELSYTQDKKFTNPTLSGNYIKSDETTFALIFREELQVQLILPGDVHCRSVAAQNVKRSVWSLFAVEREDPTRPARPAA